MFKLGAHPVGTSASFDDGKAPCYYELRRQSSHISPRSSPSS